MALIFPPEFAVTVPAILNRLGGEFSKWLDSEMQRSLMLLADAHDDVVLRQLQGRVRFIKELREAIRTQ